MDKKEKIIELLKKAIENCEKNGAESLILSIEHEKGSTNIMAGTLDKMAQAFASQGENIEDSTIPVIEKAIGIAKIIY